tara:strand:+ start:203 stop:700 length:498 start_codon:yes stop_codon:yes gene_type:complete
MQSTEPVFREEQRFSPLLIGATLVVVVPVGILAAYSAISDGSSQNAITGILVAVLPIIFILSLYVWFRLQTAVTADEIRVGFPIFPRKQIHLSNIRTSEVTGYHPLRDFGGWGLRFGAKGTMFNARGDRAVRLVLEDGAVVFIGSQRPEQLLQAISKGRSADQRG